MYVVILHHVAVPSQGRKAALAQTPACSENAIF
jgi:hypothetical protein